MAENLYPLNSSGMLGNVIMALLFLTFRRSSFGARTQPVKNAIKDATTCKSYHLFAICFSKIVKKKAETIRLRKIAQ